MPDPAAYRAWLDDVALTSLHLVELEAKAKVPFLSGDGLEVIPHVEPPAVLRLSESRFVVTTTVRADFNGEVLSVMFDEDAAPGETVTSPVGHVRAHFGAMYGCPADTDDAYTEQFKRNVLVHIWPLFRQVVRSTTSDFGWVPVVIPTVPVDPAGELEL